MPVPDPDCRSGGELIIVATSNYPTLVKAAEVLNLPWQEVLGLARSGRLPLLTVGEGQFKLLLVPQEAIQAFMSGTKVSVDPNELSGFVTLPQAASLLGTAPRTMWALIARGYIEAISVGGESFPIALVSLVSLHSYLRRTAQFFQSRLEAMDSYLENHPIPPTIIPSLTDQELAEIRHSLRFEFDHEEESGAGWPDQRGFWDFDYWQAEEEFWEEYFRERADLEERLEEQAEREELESQWEEAFTREREEAELDQYLVEEAERLMEEPQHEEAQNDR